MNKKITIREIADACDVTIATVSRAINNKLGVRNEVRQHILQYIEDIGWSCNSFNLRLLSNKNEDKNVVILCNLWSIEGGGKDSQQRTLKILIEKLEREGVVPSVVYGKSIHMLEHCLKHKPFAVILFNSHERMRDPILKLVEAGVRVIVAYGDYLSDLCPMIHNDYDSAVKLAVKKLRAIGCKKIGLFAGIGGLQHPTPKKKIYSGWLRSIAKALEKNISDFNPILDVFGDCYGDPKELLHILPKKKYDGWICCTRLLARSFCHQAEKNGIKAPEQLPIIAFGSPTDEFDPLLQIGCFLGNAEKIGNLVFDLFQKEEFPEPKEYLIPYKWKKGTVPLRFLKSK